MLGPDKETEAKVVKSIVKVYLQAQDAAAKHSQGQNQHIQLTPAHFIRIFECYRRL